MKDLEIQLKTSKDRLQMIADSVPALIAYVDCDQRYVFCNAAYDDWFGLSVKDVVGMHVQDVFDTATYLSMEPHIKKVLAGQKDSYEIQLNHRLKGPRINNTELTPHLDDNGKVLGYCVLSTDITRIKRAEADADEKNRELSNALRKIEQTNRELEQFASVCSHDLQEPLRMVKGYLELLQKRYTHLFDDKASTYFHYILKGTTRMDELIKGLLDYARLEDPVRMMGEVHLQEILGEALENIAPLTSKNNVEITSDSLPHVKGYDIQLVQLFQNLLVNSIKFRRREPPRITISAERIDNKWRISVSDNGIGISPKYSETIFKIFQRLKTENECPGTGIGLSICKKIVENHGGKIWYEGNDNQGTTFYFTLPPAAG